MCGINGFVAKEKLVNAEHRLKRMNASIVHRGPDAEGTAIYCDGKVGMGHRRLSVIDISNRSNQPLKGNCTAIIYNGEIYNYKELKRNLSYAYKTDSDTEVLLTGLEARGIEFLRQCNGMFAFALYDERKGLMTLGRDRMGIKPLYYYCDDRYFIFSSEIKGILNSGLVKAEFFEDAIDEYLGNRYIREPYTFFKNIYQLPAGHYMTVDSYLNIKIDRYWSLPESFNMDEEFDENKIYEEFKEGVIKAIKRRMISDVPWGTYLSGGIDSGLITAIASMEMETPVNTYTIGFDGLNEFPYARSVAQKYSTIHHEIIMEQKQYFDLLEEVIKYKDAPLGVPNEIPLAYMSKELKKKITVVLSGEGADELLGGYGRIYRSPFDYSNSDEGKNDFYNYFTDLYEYVPRTIRDQYLCCGCKLRSQFDEDIYRTFEKNANEENVFRFFHTYHIKGLLQRLDTTTMYASVEARVPFLDHELIELCYEKIPYKLKLKWRSEKERLKAQNMKANDYSEKSDIPKYLLRKMGGEYLSDETIARRKMGFPVPLNEWMTELIRMSEDMLKNAYWIEEKKLAALLSDCQNSARAGQILWMFVSVEVFRQCYFQHEWRY